MAEDGSLGVDVFTPVWTAGWQWPWVVLLALMIGLNFVLAAERVWIGVAVLVGGPILAVAGVRSVNRRAGEVVETGTALVERAAAESSGFEGENIAVYSLRSGIGSVVGIEQPKRYELTTVVVGETAVVVHEDVTVNVLDDSWEVGDQTAVFPYGHLSDLGYDDEEFRIDSAEGGSRSYPADRVPSEVVADIKARMSTSGTEATSQ
jgi:hypothetical protein